MTTPFQPSDTASTQPSVGLVRALSFLTVFVIGTDTFLVSSILPVLRETMHVTIAQSGWFVSAYALGYAVTAVISGPISDRIDRRTLLITGLACFTIFTGLCAAAWNFETLFTMRLLAGAAAAVCTPQIWAAIPVLVPKEKITSVMGSATAGLSIAMVAGVPIGAVLSTVNWRFPFLVVCVVSAILWAVQLFKFPHVHSTATRKGNPFSVYSEVVGFRPLSFSLLAYLLMQVGNFTAFSFIATWFGHSFGLGEAGIGLSMMVIGASQAIGSIFGSHLSNRLGMARSILFGVAAIGIFYAANGFVTNLALAIILFALAMLSGGFAYPLLMLQLQSLKPEARGTVSALANTAMYVGVTIAGAVGGTLLSHFSGFSGIAGWVAIMFAASLLFYAGAGAFKQHS